MQIRNLSSKSALSYASSQTGARTLAPGGDGVVTDYPARLLVLLWRSAESDADLFLPKTI